jgi:hypothetical protein
LSFKIFQKNKKGRDFMGIEQMIYRDMMLNGDDILIGNVEALKSVGIYVKPNDYMIDPKTTNNRLKRHGLPMRRKVR